MVQLSIDTRLTPAQHVEMGLRRAALRQHGVLLMGSGEKPAVLVEGYAYGSLSLTAYGIGVEGAG